MKFIDKLNGILQGYTDIRIQTLEKDRILLSNGKYLGTPSEIRKFKRRVSEENTRYLEQFDSLYSDDPVICQNTETQIKSELARKGGTAVQKKHGDVIKENLNTGTPWNKGKTGLQKAWNRGLTKETNSSLKKLSQARQGPGNPNYGKQESIAARQQKSRIMREKILCGEFTPNSNNRNTHWNSEYRGKKYRSSWEALCQHVYPDAEYEKLRVEYVYQGQKSIYIVDFIDHKNKIAIEVKPRELQTGEKYCCKIQALNQWCKDHGYHLKLFDQTDVICYNNLTQQEQSLFDAETVRKLQETRA